MRRQSLQSYVPLVAGLLLAVYGIAGVLGYGLHSLWGCGHCHEMACQHSAEAPSAIAGGHLFHDLRCSDNIPSMISVEQTDHARLVLAEEDCPICAFLVQAQSQVVVQMASECVDVIPIIPPALVSSYVSPLLGTHPGRGPPTC